MVYQDFKKFKSSFKVLTAMHLPIQHSAAPCGNTEHMKQKTKARLYATETLELRFIIQYRR